MPKADSLPNLKVGDTVYYRRTTGAGYFYAAIVEAETTRSWVVVPVNSADWMRRRAEYQTKIPKTLKGYELGTKRSLEITKWGYENRYKIASHVGGLMDFTLLAEIARMIGSQFQLPEEAKDEGTTRSSEGVETH